MFIPANLAKKAQTEESFINQVVAPILWPRKVYLTPIILGAPGHKGGRTSYARVKKDIVVQLKQDPTTYCSTMLDLCGLGMGFPGSPLPPNLPNIEKVTRIEQAVVQDILGTVPHLRPDVRFLPYLQLHEYEGLLFSDPAAFIHEPRLALPFQMVRNRFQTPEDIDDGPETAPSSASFSFTPRIARCWTGRGGAQAVGIDVMRREYPHFREWIERLRAFGAN